MTETNAVKIFILSGTCCYPNLAVRDQEALQVIEQALEATHIPAETKTIKATTALRGGIPIEVLQSSGLAADPSNLLRLPAVFINNQLVKLGVPTLNEIILALSKTQTN